MPGYFIGSLEYVYMLELILFITKTVISSNDIMFFNIYFEYIMYDQGF